MSLETDPVSERLGRYSGYNPEFTPQDALALFSEARERCPVGHSDQLGGFYLVFDHDAARRIHRDPTFSTVPGMFRPQVDRPQLPPTEYDPPEHDHWRRVFNLAVNGKTAALIEPGIREDVNRLLDAFMDRGTCDLVPELAVPVPLYAICRILGVDISSAAELRSLTDDLMANLAFPDKAADAYQALAAFGTKEIAERRANPRDDVLTRLSQEEVDGQRLSDLEITQVMASLLSAGHETSTVLMTSMFYEVLSRPDVHKQLLEDRSLIPAAVEETLRLHPPVMGLYRRATQPSTVSGVDIPEGSDLMLCWAATNRDPKVFDKPDEFRLDRGRNHHLTFGFGIHACLGAGVARLEMRIALEELLRRLPDIELTTDAIEYKFSGPEWVSITELPARFTPPTKPGV